MFLSERCCIASSATSAHNELLASPSPEMTRFTNDTWYHDYWLAMKIRIPFGLPLLNDRDIAWLLARWNVSQDDQHNCWAAIIIIIAIQFSLQVIHNLMTTLWPMFLMFHRDSLLRHCFPGQSKTRLSIAQLPVSADSIEEVPSYFPLTGSSRQNPSTNN